jgi:SAM-dependent methyltransferase
MTYTPSSIAAYFDRLAHGEWQRYDQSALGAVHFHIHDHYLRRFIAPGSRVLEIGAGPGRFTATLHQLGCRVVVGDISPVQLALNREYGQAHGFGASVEAWLDLDICELGALPAASFDAVVAYGGPLSYVFERREDALRGCRRVLRPGGVLLASVMSLWGTLHRHLAVLRDHPLDKTRRIIESGDLTPETDPASEHHCHMYRSDEFVALLDRHGFSLLALSASNTLSTNLEPLVQEIRQDPARWAALLDVELTASAQPGYVDGGTHLVAVARRNQAVDSAVPSLR